MTDIAAPYIADSDTSKARAQREDAAGITRDRSEVILNLVAATGTVGATWKDISDKTGLHHGQVSGVLSKLHEHGYVFQLKTTRHGCHPYVVDAYRDGFYDEERNDQPVKTRSNARLDALQAVADAAYALCYSQASGSAAKWDALRKALEQVTVNND